MTPEGLRQLAAELARSRAANETTPRSPIPICDRLLNSYRINDTCIEWTGTRRRGYGIVSWNGKRWSVHRLTWMLLNDRPIPEGMVVMHSCDNRACFNPEHLVLGTQSENIADGWAKGRVRNQNVDKTHCKYGHELIEENTSVSRLGHRHCRICDRRHFAMYDRKRYPRGRDGALKPALPAFSRLGDEQ